MVPFRYHLVTYFYSISPFTTRVNIEWQIDRESAKGSFLLTNIFISSSKDDIEYKNSIFAKNKTYFKTQHSIKPKEVISIQFLSRSSNPTHPDNFHSPYERRRRVDTIEKARKFT